MNKTRSHNQGFTLIEIMVAVSIFVIVAFISISTLIAILDASRRANVLRSITDNINFGLENLTFKMKFGNSYEVENESISFYDRNGLPLTFCRLADDDIHYLAKCDAWRSCSGNCARLTAPGINISQLQFKDASPSTDTSLVVILVKAEALVKGQPVHLDFQTAVNKNVSSESE